YFRRDLYASIRRRITPIATKPTPSKASVPGSATVTGSDTGRCVNETQELQKLNELVLSCSTLNWLFEYTAMVPSAAMKRSKAKFSSAPAASNEKDTLTMVSSMSLVHVCVPVVIAKSMSALIPV